MAQNARAQSTGEADRPAAGTMRFDLAAQSVADALRAFCRMTELLVAVQSSLLEGRLSTPVHGDYAPREALQRLLAGTGLQADFTSPDDVIIVPLTLAPQPGAAQASALIPALAIDGIMAGGDYRAYAAMLQTRLTEALCGSPLTLPGSYRLLAQLRIADTGAVVASKVLESTGSPARDAAIAQAMHALVLDSPPPATLPEPVTILLRPHGNGVDTDCTQFTGRN